MMELHSNFNKAHTSCSRIGSPTRDNLSSYDGVSLVFQLLFLSTHDCNLEFGITKGFKDVFPICQKFHFKYKTI